MTDVGETQNVKVVASNTVDERNEEVVKFLGEKEQASIPMMVFGADWKLLKLLEANKMRKVHNVDTRKKLNAIQLVAKNIENDVVLMHKSYGCGIDLNF